MKVELLYDANCPNVAPARSLLINAFARTGVSARWKEWERSAPDSPSYVRGYGSPTLLVNGRDVAGIEPSPGTHACRLYTGSNGELQRTPPFDLICAALLEVAPAGHANAPRGRWQAVAASMPAVGTALLSKLTCPLCWPAYAALLSALGFGLFDYTLYLLPLTLLFLALAIGGLALYARRSGRRGALIAGAAGAAFVLLGKFGFERDWLSNVGIGLLVIAIFVSMRRGAGQGAPCSACANGNGYRDAEAETR